MAKEYVAYDGPVVTRDEALVRGLKRYFTGCTCSRGHLSERYVTGTACIACIYENNEKHRTRDGAAYKQKRSIRRRERYYADIDASRAYFRAAQHKWYWKDPAANAAKALEWRKKKYPKQVKPEPSIEEIAAKEERRKLLKKASRKRTYEKNKIRVLAEAAAYRAAHKAEERAARRAHYQRNKEHVAKTTAAYRIANPDLYAAAGAKRRASRRNATPPWADLKKIRAIYNEARRLMNETGILHEVDHVYPLQGKMVCGLHVENNLRIVTRFVNRSKGASLPETDQSI